MASFYYREGAYGANWNDDYDDGKKKIEIFIFWQA